MQRWHAMTQDYLRPCLTNAASCLQAARVFGNPRLGGFGPGGVRDEGVRRDSWRHPDSRTYGCRFAVVPAPRHSHCGCCVNRWGRNCRVGAARAGHRAWRHNRDEHPVVGELLAHCDRHLGTATGTPTAATPSGGTATAGTRRGGTPAPAPRRAATPAWEPPEVVAASASAASSATAAGVKVRRAGHAAFVSITNNANKPAVGCVYRSVAVAGVAAGINYNADACFHRNRLGGDEDPRGSQGPATGSTFHVTVTCDNGLSTSVDRIY